MLTGLLLAAGLRRGRRQAVPATNDSVPEVLYH
jgi:hypothetical protein